MATQNLSRLLKRNLKKAIRVFYAELDYLDVLTSADIYQLFELPKEAYVTKAQVYIITASNSATSAAVDVGFDGGDTLIDGGNLKTAATGVLSGGTNSVIPIQKTTGGTVTFKPTYVGAPTAGKFGVLIEYIEYTRHEQGELTNFST